MPEFHSGRLVTRLTYAAEALGRRARADAPLVELEVVQRVAAGRARHAGDARHKLLHERHPVHDAVGQRGAVVGRRDRRHAPDPFRVDGVRKQRRIRRSAVGGQHLHQHARGLAAHAVRDEVHRVRGVPRRIQPGVARAAVVKEGLGLFQVAVGRRMQRAVVHAAALDLVEKFGRAVPVRTERADDGGGDELVGVPGLQLLLQVVEAAPVLVAEQFVASESGEAVDEDHGIAVGGEGWRDQREERACGGRMPEGTMVFMVCLRVVSRSGRPPTRARRGPRKGRRRGRLVAGRQASTRPATLVRPHPHAVPRGAFAHWRRRPSSWPRHRRVAVGNATGAR